MGQRAGQANLLQLPYPGMAQRSAWPAEGASLDRTGLQLGAELPDAHGHLQTAASAGAWLTGRGRPGTAAR